MLNFGLRLKKLRKEQGLSQEQLANELNLSRSTISNYEKNKRLPDLHILCQMASFFDISTDYLIGRTNNKKSFHQQTGYDSSIITFIVDPKDASFIDCSISAINFFGYPKEVLLSKKVYETTVTTKEQVMNHIKEALEVKHKVIVGKHITSKGKIKDVQVTITPFKVEGKTLLYCIANDLTSYLNRKKILSTTILEMADIISQLCHKKFCFKSEHQKRVARIAVALGKKMNIPQEQIRTINISGLLHDIGELYLPEVIINKPDKLTSSEYEIIKKHPEWGYSLIQDVDYLKTAAEIIIQHHERIDGSGYPEGIKGKEIKLEAKILAVADVLEALTSIRPYRSAVPFKKALKMLSDKKGEKYDQSVVDACLELYNDSNFKKIFNS